MREIDIESWEPDEFGEKSLAAFIMELQWLLDDHNQSNEIVISLEQSGDQWDGWGCASLVIRRPETDDEKRQREEENAERLLQMQRREAEKRAELYRALKAEFEK